MTLLAHNLLVFDVMVSVRISVNEVILGELVFGRGWFVVLRISVLAGRTEMVQHHSALVQHRVARGPNIDVYHWFWACVGCQHGRVCDSRLSLALALAQELVCRDLAQPRVGAVALAVVILEFARRHVAHRAIRGFLLAPQRSVAMVLKQWLGLG